MEEKITLTAGRYRLEGYWQAGARGTGAVITHPHPLYGGTMNNPVVETVQSAYQQYGYATLRFNFRGVGGSQGNFDNGLGEQNDVRAAISYVENMDVSAIDLAGYSFGAWVNTGVVTNGEAVQIGFRREEPRKDFEEEGETATLRRVSMLAEVPTKELYTLFPKKPARKMAYIAGLPKPKGCI